VGMGANGAQAYAPAPDSPVEVGVGE
jgi:hypothetical protein